MADGFTNAKKVGMYGPPIFCLRTNCKGSIPSNVCAHKLFMGTKPKCFECARVGQTTFFKLPPGMDRKYKNGKLINTSKPPNGGNEEQAINKKQAAEIAELKRQLNEKGRNINKATEDAKGDGGTSFNKEDSILIKTLSKDLAKLEDLDESDKKLYFPDEGEYGRRIQGLKDQMQQIWASNRDRLPIKVQWEKQRTFVNKCEAELNLIKEEQTAIMLKYQELEEDILSRTASLASKKVELANLAARAAQEDAVDTADGIINAPPMPIASIPADDAHHFNVLRAVLQKSNVHDLLIAEGATGCEMGSMVKMLEAVSKVVEQL